MNGVEKLPKYRICPSCTRAVPIGSDEYFCINDGTPLIEQCPVCQTKIYSPYAKNCAKCGYSFASKVASILPALKLSKKPLKTFKAAAFIVTIFVMVGLIVGLSIMPKSAPWQTILVGKIPQSKAFIAIAINHSKVMAYVCDGQQIAEWFVGNTQNQQLELRSKSGAVLKAKVSLENAQGTVELESGYFAFSALVAGDQAGLYRAENSDMVAGWIVLKNGEFRAAYRQKTKVQALEFSPFQVPADFAFRPKKIDPRANGF